MYDIGKKAQVIELARISGIVRPGDLLEASLPREYLSRLAKEGLLERVGRGLYRLPGADLGQHENLIEVAKRVPNGVLVLLSALKFHNFTTQNPFEVWLAVDGRAWKPKIDYPPVRYISSSGEMFSEGVEEHKLEGVAVKVYCPAKTVADCFKHRNKIGLDVALEALREGWRDRRFTMSELTDYAEIDRVANVMRPYMESLV